MSEFAQCANECPRNCDFRTNDDTCRLRRAEFGPVEWRGRCAAYVPTETPGLRDPKPQEQEPTPKKGDEPVKQTRSKFTDEEKRKILATRGDKSRMAHAKEVGVSDVTLLGWERKFGMTPQPAKKPRPKKKVAAKKSSPPSPAPDPFPAVDPAVDPGAVETMPQSVAQDGPHQNPWEATDMLNEKIDMLNEENARLRRLLVNVLLRVDRDTDSDALGAVMGGE